MHEAGDHNVDQPSPQPDAQAQPAGVGLWGRLAACEAAPGAARTSSNLWATVDERTDPAKLRLQRIDDIERRW